MNEETTKALTNLAKMFGSDRVLTSQEIDKVLNGILKMLLENKKETEALNVETKAQVEKLLNKFLDKYAVFVEDMKTLEGDVSDIQSEMLKKVENKISEVTYLLEEAKKINVKEEKLELDDIVQAVMENITLPEVQEMMEISGERIIDLINDTPNTDENKISWFKIKDIPEFFTTPQTKKGKLKEGGMSPTVLRQAVDLDHSTRADGYGIVWNEALGKHIYSAAGGGGGSGTVNSGTQYRLGYYATTSTEISELAAITASRVLVSDTNGLPTHSTVTTTTLGYLDATSSIQTQLNAKIASSYLDTDTTLAANSDVKIATQKAVKTYVDNAVTGLLDLKGSTDCSENPNYPAASKGDSYYVTAAGKIGGASGKSVDIGDVYVALADNDGGKEASVGTSWFVMEHNLSGVALTTSTLAQFAATTSSQLAGVISDETGSGALVFANTPTLVTPILGAATGTSVFLTGTTEQLRLLYDGSNYASFTVNSGGDLTIDTSGNDVIIASTDKLRPTGGISTSTTDANANFYIASASAGGAGTQTEVLIGGAAAMDCRGFMRGSTSITLSANRSYANFIFGTEAITEATSGTHAIISNVALKPVAITNGTATSTNGATLYIESAATGTTPTNNYALWVDADTTRLDGNLVLGGNINDINGNEEIIFTATASAVNEFTFINAATGNAPQITASGGDTNVDIKLVPKGTGIVKGELKRFMVRLVASDTDQATGTAIGGDYRISNRAITVKAVGSYCDTAGTTGTYTVDINEAGTTIMSTNKITVDSTEKSSETAATPPAVTDAAIAADAIITFDVDAVQTTKAKGLVVWIDYVYA